VTQDTNQGNLVSTVNRVRGSTWASRSTCGRASWARTARKSCCRWTFRSTTSTASARASSPRTSSASPRSRCGVSPAGARQEPHAHNPGRAHPRVRGREHEPRAHSRRDSDHRAALRPRLQRERPHGGHHDDHAARARGERSTAMPRESKLFDTEDSVLFNDRYILRGKDLIASTSGRWSGQQRQGALHARRGR